MTLETMAARRNRDRGGGSDPTKGQRKAPKMRAVKGKGEETWDVILFEFPYSPEAVEHLKKIIPWQDRKWDAQRKIWRIARKHLIPLYLAWPHAIMTPPIAQQVRKYTRNIRPPIESPKALKEVRGFRGTLRPYQLAAIEDFIVGGHAHNLLTDEQGLGKTPTALGYVLKQARLEGHDPEEIVALIICPNTAKFTVWKEQAEKFTNLAVQVIDGSRTKREVQWDEPANLYVVNYEGTRTQPEMIHDVDWDFIICDEAHRLGNPESQQSMATFGCQTKHWFFMSGTPAQNKLEQMQPILLQAGITDLGLVDFKDEYLVQAEGRYGKKTVAYRNLDHLVPLISKRSVRRLQEEVLKDVPDLTEQEIRVGMSATQKKMYNEMIEQGIVDLGDGHIRTYTDFRVMITGLLMVCQSPALIERKIPIYDENGWRIAWEKTGEFGKDDSEKLDELVRILSEDILYADKKAVVLSAYRRTSELLEERLKPHTDTVTVRGGVPVQERAELIHRFQTDPDVGVYLGTVEANKEAITLTAAQYVFSVGLPWTPGDWAQAKMRIKRKDEIMERRIREEGKKFKLIAYDVLVGGSIEDWHRKGQLEKNSVLGLGRGDDAIIERGITEELTEVLKRI